MLPLISVIVPVHNVAPFLERCVKSLIGQSYRKLEIILIDDGSNDCSGEICEQFRKKDERVKVLHQNYYGVSDARNKGLALASGEYIVFLDSDDEAHTDYVKRLFDTLLTYELDIAQCCLLRIRHDEPVNKRELTGEINIFSGLEMQYKIFERNRFFSMCLCGKLFKRVLFDGLEFPVGRINEDESLIYLLMYRSHRVGIVDEYLYYYHYNEKSITEQRYNIHRLDAFYMLEEKFAFYQQQELKELADKTAREYFSQIAVAFDHRPDEIEDYDTWYRKACDFYSRDRQQILEKASLGTMRYCFMKLSYLSIHFVKWYGLLLKWYLSHKK